MGNAFQVCSADASGTLTPLSPQPAPGTQRSAGTVSCTLDTTTHKWVDATSTIQKLSAGLSGAGSTGPAPTTAPDIPPTTAPLIPPTTAPAIPSVPTTTEHTAIHSAMGTSGILLVICTVLVLLTVITFVATWSILATLVVIAILVGFILLLNKLGVLTVSTAGGNLDIEYHEMNSSTAQAAAPAPSTSSQAASTPKPVNKNQVFHVGGNDYTYQDAPAVCAAYDAELATYDQINDAYNSGAEWCAYGWSQGGMALYPTQKSTWATMQADPNNKTSCGHPGVNGGYFDTATQFGVNCYGQKPADNTNSKYPVPITGTDSTAFAQAVNKFKNQMGSMSLNPFNRTSWSQ